MFVRREGWLPQPSSLSTVRDSAKLVAETLGGAQELTQYLSYHDKRLGFDLDYTVELSSKQDRILEIGGWPLFLTMSLASRGFNVETIDKNGSRIAEVAGRLGLTVHDFDVEQDAFPLEDETYDYVIMNEVFEHLRIDLIHTFSEIRRIMKPGGRLTISTPNLRSLIGLYNFLFKGEAYACEGGIYRSFSTLRRDRLGSMGHVREYTPKEVMTFLEDMKFRVDGIIYRACYDRPRWWHYATLIRPDLKPFFSVFATKV